METVLISLGLTWEIQLPKCLKERNVFSHF